jgi:hypothetical protein
MDWPFFAQGFGQFIRIEEEKKKENIESKDRLTEKRIKKDSSKFSSRLLSLGALGLLVLYILSRSFRANIPRFEDFACLQLIDHRVIRRRGDRLG